MSDEEPTRPLSESETAAPDPSSLKGLTMALGIEPADPSQDPLLGRDIGGVTIIRLIAEGGMGRVYEGLQGKPRRPVAVKVMRPGFVTKETCRRFDQESELLGRLRHPFIAQIYSAGICKLFGVDVPYFVMEFISDSLPLTRFASQYKLTTEQRLELFRKVCEAVAHGHEKGVIHRDLKPSNILVEPSGMPKVIDFGIARSMNVSPDQMTAMTDIGQLIGTLQYMSPEQFSADPSQVDTRADVYALGVILYELLTGKPPYEINRKAIFEAAEVVRKQKPVSLSKLNRSVRPDVERITGTCLQKDPAQRYSNAAELAKAVGAYLGNRPLTATLPRPQRVPIAIFGGLLAAVLGFAVLMNVLGRGYGRIGGVETADHLASLRNSIGMELRLLPSGTFRMGLTRDGVGGPRFHEMRITEPFYLGVTEVTNAQWKAVMGEVPSKWTQGNLPVGFVSCQDAARFCEKLSALPAEKSAGRTYRLPTEAEWEYACRAGTTTQYSFGNNESVLGEYAWFDRNAYQSTHPVGLKKPNAWGLYDMHGNVWEWCSGWHEPLLSTPVSYPFARGDDDWVWFRGGSIDNGPVSHRAGGRYQLFRPKGRAPDVGFRVVLVASGTGVTELDDSVEKKSDGNKTEPANGDGKASMKETAEGGTRVIPTKP